MSLSGSTDRQACRGRDRDGYAATHRDRIGRCRPPAQLLVPSRSRRYARVAAVALALLLPVGVGACGDDGDVADEAETTTSLSTSSTTKQRSTPEITEAWARTATTGGNGAIYMEIAASGQMDALVGATVPADVAGRVELHETTADTGGGSGDSDHMGGSSTTMGMGGGSPSTTGMGGGIMKMRKVEKIPVPAGGSVSLKPGGYHVMLFDLKKDLAVGDSMDVTLTFEQAGEVTLTAQVREI